MANDPSIWPAFELCDSEFFNLNTTWYTKQPKLSPCFRNTVLVWIPTAVFSLALVKEYFNIRQAKIKSLKAIPWNRYNRLKIFLTFIIFLLKLSEFIIYTYFTSTNFRNSTQDLDSIKLNDSPAGFKYVTNDVLIVQENQHHQKVPETIVISMLLAPLMQSICYSILILIYIKHRLFGIHTSGSSWFYLFSCLICASLSSYSASVSPSDPYVTYDIATEYSHLSLVVLLFILECRGDEPMVEKDPADDKPQSPELKASFCSSIVFWWYNSFLLFGYRCRLTLADLWRTLPRDRARNVVPLFRDIWTRPSSRGAVYQLSSGKPQSMNSIGKVLFKLFWSRLILAALLKLTQDSLQYVTPMILKRLLSFMSSAYPQWHGTLYAMLLLIVPTIQSVVLGNYFYQMQVIGLQVKTMIIGSIYRKALSLSGSSRLQSTSGEIVNLMAVDSQRFQDLLLYINLFWSAPFQIGLAIWLLHRELGWSVFAGVGCMALFLPVNAYLANRIKWAQIKVMKTKDGRIRQMNEILTGIKVIKLYAWENSFIKNLFDYRNKELRYLNKILTLDAIQSFLWQCCPLVVAIVTFAVFTSSDEANVLDAEKAFVSISLFNLLRFPLTMLPSLVSSLVLTVVSARRINKFLNNDELVHYVTRNEELEAIAIEGGTMSWSAPDESDLVSDNVNDNGNISQHIVDFKPSTISSDTIQTRTDSRKPILRDIDLHVKRNTFVAIVGQVASGKSSLLASILGEMHRITGRFNISKDVRIAYVPQQPWIQNMTVRDNILFGLPYDDKRYKSVLSICALTADLETLPGGDQSEIGEKGINLSGGQKQRVSLARACYSNADLFLLDDPLSALDSHVAKHVFDQVLSSKTGLLRNKTRVLATNSLFVLPYVDQIVVLDDGRVVESGTYEELSSVSIPETSAETRKAARPGTARGKGYLANIMRQYSITKMDTSDQQKPISLESDPKGDIKKTDSIDSSESRTRQPLRQQEQSDDITGKTKTQKSKSSGRLTEIEKVEVGSVNYKVYLGYFRAVSLFWLAAVVVALISSTAFSVGSNIWLSVWSADAEDPEKVQDEHLRTTRLLVYASLGGLQCFTAFSGALALSRGAIRAAKMLHIGLLERVMHSPMNFFDTTPNGRIVNRFAKDIDVVDSTLPGTFRSWFGSLLQVLSTVFVICYSFPTFLVILIPLAIMYSLIQKVFIVTTRQLKRLESITRSPIYSHFSETLSGISTIRAYDCVNRFVVNSDDLVDQNQSCSYPNIIANRWLSVRLEFFGNVITACAALFSVYYKGDIGAGVAGLTISYSLSITQSLSWLVRMTSDLETNIVSVERIREYMGNNQEDAWIKPDSRPPAEWPSKGSIEIQDYSTRYRDDTELVLKDVSISIKPREKIGIVGRTGSGKSSLSLALFRILEPTSGGIRIDNLDLTKFGLHDIRSHLTIIPQDPVLFSGTLRFNLDPLKLYSDIDIWRALELAHLNNHFNDLKSGLDYHVSEYGENFSVGQRQLICLARAILRKSKILILDEATASVDLETDSFVQKTIRKVFEDCTIITIAHRLHTILDSDRILVLECGHPRELDRPDNLVANPESVFASLVRDAGIDTSDYLKEKQLRSSSARQNYTE